MRLRFKLGLACLTFWVGATAYALETTRIKLGIVPYLSPQVLLSLYAPVVAHLQKELAMPVEAYTAVDVSSFVKKALRREYDVLITSAHLMRLVQLNADYVPLTQYRSPLYASVFVAKNSRYQNLYDLRGHFLAVTDRSILVNLEIFKTLDGLKIKEKDLQLQLRANQNSALLGVAQGQSDAAIAAHFILDQIPPEQSAGLREIYRSQALPNVMQAASANLSPALRAQVQQAMLSLSDTDAGREFLRQSRFEGVKKVDLSSMKSLDKYLFETVNYLGLE